MYNEVPCSMQCMHGGRLPKPYAYTRSNVGMPMKIAKEMQEHGFERLRALARRRCELRARMLLQAQQALQGRRRWPRASPRVRPIKLVWARWAGLRRWRPGWRSCHRRRRRPPAPPHRPPRPCATSCSAAESSGGATQSSHGSGKRQKAADHGHGSADLNGDDLNDASSL